MQNDTNNEQMASREITLSVAKKSDIDTSLNILNEGLGEGFVTLSELTTYIEGDNKTCVVAKEGNTILAVITAEVFSSTERFLSSAPADMAGNLQHIIQLLPREVVGVIKSVVVSQSAQKRGIASLLITETEHHLQALGATELLSIGWTDGAGCHIQKALESAGYTNLGDIEKFWFQDSIILGYSCPTCSSPCHCIARIFRKTVPI